MINIRSNVSKKLHMPCRNNYLIYALQTEMNQKLSYNYHKRLVVSSVTIEQIVYDLFNIILHTELLNYNSSLLSIIIDYILMLL